MPVTASAIYAASVSGMFGISALYHRGSWSAPGAGGCSGWIMR
jgi:predicted membrane channel-forming protein YqfA (hemolysin III family)